MKDTTYRIVFEGETTPGKDKDEIKINLIKLFNLSEDTATKFLNQRRAVIKKNVPAKIANNYLSALNKAGIVAKMEPEHISNPTSPKAKPEIINKPEVVTKPEIINKPEVVTKPEIINKPEVVTKPEIINKPEVVTKPEIINKPEVVTKPEIIKKPQVITKSEKNINSSTSSPAPVKINSAEPYEHNAPGSEHDQQNISPSKRKIGFFTYIAAGFLLIIFTGTIAGYFITSSKPEADPKISNIGHHVVTFDDYQKIQSGMSYSQVISIVGAEGEVMSRYKLEGTPGIRETVETVMYQWGNSRSSNISAMFKNDKLVKKSQSGLK